MTTLAVRFDQELSVAHAIETDSALPCPKGVFSLIRDPWVDRNGSRRTVEPCSLVYGHGGNCETGTRSKDWRTVCGLSLDDLPFVPSPGGMKACSACFDGEETIYVEEAMFA